MSITLIQRKILTNILHYNIYLHADVKYIAFGNDHNDIVMLQHASSGYL